MVQPWVGWSWGYSYRSSWYRVGFEGQPIDMDVVVADLGETEAIVGLDFLDTHQSAVNTERQSLDIEIPHLSIPLYRRKVVVSQVEESTSVVLSEDLHIPGSRQLEVHGRVTGVATMQTMLVEGQDISQRP